MRVAALAAAAALAAHSAGAEIALTLPVACELGVTCHIQQYMDRDPGPGSQDFMCSGLSYDGHKGTDFAVPTLTEMDHGVAVLAAAPGVVAGVRDGMADRFYQSGEDLGGRDCGNGLVLRHGDGWETQYCHLLNGSVQVATGDRVERGQPLGLIGLSGRTQFPHLHLSVRHDGTPVDPFDADGSGCDGPDRQLWQDPVAYQPGGLLDAGFADAVPSYNAIKEGRAAKSTLSSDDGALVLFAYLFGGRAGDVIELQIDGPQGTVHSQTVDLEKTQAQLFRASGRRTPPEGWPPGIYRGHVRFLRGDRMLGQRQVTLRIRP